MRLSNSSELASVLGLTAIPPLPPMHYVRPVLRLGGMDEIDELKPRVIAIVHDLLSQSPHEFTFNDVVNALPGASRYDIQNSFLWLIRHDKTITKRRCYKPGTVSGLRSVYSRIPQEHQA